MPGHDETQALRAEVELLKAELARLRATHAACGVLHLSTAPAAPAAAGNYAGQLLTFGNTTGAAPLTFGLPASAFAGGCAGGGYTVTVWHTAAGGDCS